MKLRYLLIGWVLLAEGTLHPDPCRADPLSATRNAERHQQALFDRIAPSVVFVSMGTAFGSGFFVDDNGLVLTNAHVVGKAGVVKVVRNDGEVGNATVLKRASDNLDLVLIQTPFKNTPALLLDARSLRIGSWVAAVGHGRGGIWTFTTGMVSNIYPTKRGRSVFQTQIPLNPGASGGPIVDLDGNVLGVVTAGISDSNGINFAIRADVAIGAFKELEPQTASTRYLVITAPARTAVFLDGSFVGQGPRVRVVPTPGAHEVMAVVEGTLQKHQIVWPTTSHVTLMRQGK